jgi:hypothetical protein
MEIDEEIRLSIVILFVSTTAQINLVCLLTEATAWVD